MKTLTSLRLSLKLVVALCSLASTPSWAQTCVAPPADLVSWWRAEGSGADQVGGNTGTARGNTTYGPGRVGSTFVFDGDGDSVTLGNPPSLQLQNLTIETWIRRSSASVISYGTDGGGFLLSYGPGGYVFYLGGNAHLYFAKVGDPAQSSAGTITDTNYHHVAVTKSGTTVTFYIDGVVNTVASSGSTFVFTTPVAIGAQGNNADNSFWGTIDEMAVYNRALSTNEIQGIYAAGTAGKCSTAAAPYILTQPAPQTVTAGANVSFSVLAGGTPPLSYQWSFNGTNLSGATTSALVLNNVQVSDSGSYAVVVSNSVSTVTSSNAVLTVNPLTCVTPAAGLVSWWRAEGSAADELGGNTGTLAGNAAYGAGRSGQGFVFDGTADFVSLGNPANLQLQNFTIETWIKRSSASVISHGTDGGGFLLSYGAGGYVFYLGGNARLIFAKSGDAAVSSAGTITDTNFHHVAVTKAGSTVTFYIDGMANTVASVGSTFTFTTSVVIGAQGTGGDNSFLGTIDELAVYNRALSGSELEAIYTAGSLGKCPTSAPPATLLNVQFASQQVKSGFAATGLTGSDFWNSLYFPFQSSAGLGGLKLADGTVTGAGLTVQNGAGHTGFSHPDLMYRSCCYAQDFGDITLTVTNLPAGEYDFYLYGHAGSDTANTVFQLLVGGNNFGNQSTTTSSSWSLTNWVEGAQYVVYHGVTITNGGAPVIVKCHPGASGYTYLNGIQIKSAGPTPLAIVSQPVSQSVFVGADVTFSVGALGTPPLNYQWRFNGNDMAGQTGSSLVVTNVQLTNSGNFSVVVSNAVGSVASSNALLTVNAFPPVTLLNVQFASQQVKSGYAATGLTGGDFWNSLYFPFQTSAGLGGLKLADGLATGAGLTVQNGAGHTGFSHPDLMYRSCCYAQDFGDITLTVTNLPAGEYDFYLYGHAGSDTANTVFQLLVGGNNFGNQSTTTSSSWSLTNWVEGAQYVVYRGVTITNGGAPVIVKCHPGASGYTYLNGVQIRTAGPTPPLIVSQPASQSLLVGADATFSVTADGTPPLSYQWRFNGTNLNGATATALILTNVQPADAGNYSVVVSNVSGTATSSNAVLTVNAPPPCSTPPAGLVSWWTGNGSSADSVGTNHASLQNGAGITAGLVGQAIGFDGSDDYAVIPASSTLDVGTGGGLTIEGWINPADVNSVHALWEWNDGVGDYGVHVWFSIPNYGGVRSIFANLQDTINNDHFFASAPGIMTAGSFQHIALTYDKASGVARIYHNGTVVANQNLGVFTPQTFQKLYLGTRPAGAPPIGSYFNGVMDEVSLYNRALTAAEVQAIFGVGSAGKCSSPVAPYIFAQPTNQAVTVGGAAAFTVFAGGSQPLSYQWSFNGTNLSGATSSALMLTNVQLGDAGYYAVVVSNTVDTITSSNALLVVNPAPLCIPAPTYLAGWWKGEGDGADTAGGNVGVLSGGLSFGTGTVGQAFVFNGTDASVVISNQPNLNVGSGSGLTIEAWIKPAGTSPMPLVEWNSGAGGNPYGVHLWTSVGGAGRLFANVVDSAGNHLTIQSATGLLSTSAFQHVALNYEKATGIAKLYLNGQIVAQANLGTFTPRTHYNCYLGFRPAGGVARYTGSMDEISIYARALSDAEIQAIFSAGSVGKCATPVAPYIVTQPTNQSVVAGANATLRVIAGGTPPLSYQWNFNGTNLDGATDAAMTLNAVQVAQSGNYAVVVTNVAGTAISSNAVLTVNLPPAALRVLSTNATSSSTVAVPIVLVANGNENAVGFSLNFDPTVLSFSGVALGSGASGASLISNTNQIGSGKLGLAVAMPAGLSMTAGTQEVVRIEFVVAIVTNNTVTPLGFGDQPIIRQLVDVPGNPLAATFTGGTISIPPVEYEGDVSPRPEGNRSLTIADWVLVGRYVARLDYPTNSVEFQRADCAPRLDLGNGLLTTSDWVQAGRYAAFLDPATPVGGPGAETALAPMSRQSMRKKDGEPQPSSRQVSVSNALLLQGRSGNVSVVLEALGNENALGVSLAFDPAVLSFAGVEMGSGAAAATLNVNSNQVSAGKLGLLLALPAGGSFAAGSRELVKVNLQALPGMSGSYPVSFADVPVPREVSDPTASTLPATYLTGTVTINPPPSLRISRSEEAVVLAWPQWATNFGLEECAALALPSLDWTNVATTPMVTNNESTVTLPIGPEPRFYRLRAP